MIVFKKNSLIGNLYYKLSKNSKIIYRRVKGFLFSNHDVDKKLIFNLSDKKFPTWNQFKQLKHFINKREKKVIVIAFILFIFSFSGLIFRLISNKLIDVPAYSGEYSEALVGSIQYINPILNQFNDVDRDMARLVFSSIFKINANGELENDLIKGYELSEDQKVYTFYLRDNIFWHDGVKFSVDDIGFTLSAIQNQNFNSPLYRTFQGVKFEKKSEDSFNLILNEPFSPFLSTLTFGILPAHLWEAILPENAYLTELNRKPIGTGPFKYKTFRRDNNGNIRQYTLERFDNYYQQKPYLKTIVFKLFDNLELALDSLRSNNVDGISFIDRDNFNKIKDSRDINIYEFNMPRYTALFFNPQKKELLKNLKIRQALSWSVNKKELIEEIGSNEIEAYGPLDFIIESGEDIFDFEQAEALLKELDWEKDENNLLKKEEENLELTITSVDNSEYIKILQYLKKQWEKLGIIVNLEIIPKQKITSQIIEPRDYEIFLYGQVLSYDPDPYIFWHSSQIKSGLNLSIFADQNIDKPLEEARHLNSFEERLEKYKEFQEKLKEQYLALFLFRPTYRYPVNKKIKGIKNQVIYLPADRFTDISNWYLKTKKTFKK